MKPLLIVKLTLVLVILAASVLLIVLVTVSPVPSGPSAKQRVDAKPPQALPETAAETAIPPAPGAASAAVAVPVAPGPVPPEEDQIRIEARIRESVYPKTPWERLKQWWKPAEPRLPEADFENARGLYLRFLENFARIETAQFRVETFKTLKDGSQRLQETKDFAWTPERRRLKVARVDEAGGPITTVCDGEVMTVWRDGRLVETAAAPNPRGGTAADSYLFSDCRKQVLDRTPNFLCFYTVCEIDNGSAGYSRLQDVFGEETRFNTATGLLSEERSDYRHRTFTYQVVAGMWFLREILETSESGETRQVVSEVVLNEPVDESLFDVDNPG